MAKRNASDSGALDPALTQKKRARRRLVGALALGVAAAVVLPLVLDSEPRQTITDVQVEIPPRDTPLPPKTAAAEPPVVPPATAEAPASAAPRAEPPKSEAAKSEVPRAEPKSDAPRSPAAAGAGQTPAGERSATAQADPMPGARPQDKPAGRATDRTGAKPADGSTDKSASRSGDKPADKSTGKPADKPTEKSADRSTAKSPDKPPEKVAAAGRFVLQVGAYANAASARSQVEKVSQAGVRAYTETVNTTQGARTRVRVGPFASREAAEQVRAKLQLAGIDATVVAP